MIASQVIGKSFMGALDYNLKKLFLPDGNKRAELLSTNFTSTDVRGIASEIKMIRSLRPNLSRYVYLHLSYRLIERFYRRLKPVLMDRSRLEFRWLRRLLAATALLWILWIIDVAVGYFSHRNKLGIYVDHSLYIYFAVIIIWTAMAAFLQPRAARLALQLAPLPKQAPPEELTSKGAWLKQAMEVEKYHQDQDLTLVSLAGKLGLTTHELSRIINSGLKKSFSDFISEYRVREVILKMQNPAYERLTMMGIAYDSGFSSKSAFHRIFREKTGKSPSEYKAYLIKGVPVYKSGQMFRSAAIISNHETITKWPQGKLNRNYMFRNYLKIAWRNIARNKAYTSINVLGLSLGVCACLVIYLITSFELSYDTFHPDKDRIYRIVVAMQDAHGNKNDGASGVVPLPMAVRNELSGLDAVAGFYTYFPKVTIPGIGNTAKKFLAQKEGEDYSRVIVTEPEYFRIFVSVPRSRYYSDRIMWYLSDVCGVPISLSLVYFLRQELPISGQELVNFIFRGV